MQIVVKRLVAALWFASLLASCEDDPPGGVGDMCVPTSVPCDSEGRQCGFRVQEFYLETPSPQCATGACVVAHVDNGTLGSIPADPRVSCEAPGAPAGCLSQEAIRQAMYCSCRCGRADGTEGKSDCTCGDEYACRALGVGLDSYCVKR